MGLTTSISLTSAAVGSSDLTHKRRGWGSGAAPNFWANGHLLGTRGYFWALLACSKVAKLSKTFWAAERQSHPIRSALLCLWYDVWLENFSCKFRALHNTSKLCFSSKMLTQQKCTETGKRGWGFSGSWCTVHECIIYKSCTQKCSEQLTGCKLLAQPLRKHWKFLRLQKWMLLFLWVCLSWCPEINLRCYFKNRSNWGKSCSVIFSSTQSLTLVPCRAHLVPPSTHKHFLSSLTSGLISTL